MYKGLPVFLDCSEMPRFQKPRPMPYSLQGRDEDGLIQMENDGVLVRVLYASCTALIVSVAKKNSEKLCVCGDFRVTYTNVQICIRIQYHR